MTGPYLASSDLSDEHEGIVCTRAGDLTSDLRTLYIAAKALKWLAGL